MTLRGQIEVKHIAEGCNLENLADRAMVTKLNRKSWVAGLESPLAWTSHDRKRSKRGPTEGPRYWDRDEVTVNDQ